MAKKTGNYQIPFNSETGDQLHYPELYFGGKLEMRDNFEFEDTISFDTYLRGRSAAYFIFKRSTGEKLVVFLTDMCDMIPRMVEGKVTGTFTFTKRGANFGTKIVGL